MDIFVKDVDKSLLKEGMSIPHKYQQELLDGLNIDLEFGHKIDVDIVLEDDVFDATLKNQSYDKEKYKDHVPVMQIRYSPNSDLAKRLREVFHRTQQYMEANNTTKIPEEEREFVKISLPGDENTIEFKPVLNKDVVNIVDKSEQEEKEIQCRNIDRMSKILLDRVRQIDEMEALLQEIDSTKAEFEELKEYFISSQRLNDIIDDENGEIPDSINRAALTQDELYNLLDDNHDIAIHMMESAVGMLKENK